MNNFLKASANLCRYAIIFAGILTLGSFCVNAVFAGAKGDATEYCKAANRKFDDGDYNKSLDYYKKALKINRSKENIEGAAFNLINMASVYYKLGENESANKSLDEIFGELRFRHNHSALLADAAIIKTLINIRSNNLPAASEWLGKASSFPQNKESNTQGRVYNLKARLAILNKDFKFAVELGKKGIAHNRQIDDAPELANSLRFTAKGHVMLGEYGAAKSLCDQAIAIDKQLGASGKIVADLFTFGDIFFKQNKFEEAMSYYLRSKSVAENSGDYENAKHADAMTIKCNAGQKSVITEQLSIITNE